MQNQCPQCAHTGPENFFGTLGSVKTIHFRCRMCGWMWWCVQEDQEPEDDDAEDELWKQYTAYIVSIIVEQDDEDPEVLS